MASCIICQHAKREAIDAALLEGRLIAVVARQFRLNPSKLEEHYASCAALPQGSTYGDLSHQGIQGKQDGNPVCTQVSAVPPACAEAISLGSQRLANCERFLVAIMDRLEQVLGNEAGLHELDMHDAEQQFQQAWQQMKEEPTRQQRMIAWLNEQLQRDDMGLP